MSDGQLLHQTTPYAMPYPLRTVPFWLGPNHRYPRAKMKRHSSIQLALTSANSNLLPFTWVAWRLASDGQRSL